ncbi:MAG: tetratricopeptide repeat protein [candidate division KSB1 bacterium]|nr:tetratricopeptide repeat protein [candidate division KSB1 bacterium]
MISIKFSKPAECIGGLLLFLGLLFPGEPVRALDPAGIQKAIEHSLCQDYDTALAFFDSLELKFPDRPEPRFYKASVIQSKMMDYETLRWEDEFLRSIESAVDKADQCLQNDPGDLDAVFARGAAKSYKSFYLGRQAKYLQSVLLARQGIGDLQDILRADSSYLPAYLGLGSYLYWRSRITQSVNWLPFFSDQRQTGINYLEKVADSQSIGRWSAVSNLAWIYLEEENWEQALYYSQKGLHAFPDSRFFLWPCGETLLHMKRYADALQVYETLLNSVLAAPINNHYNEIVLYFKMAQCCRGMENPQQAVEYLKQNLNTKPDAEVRDRCLEKQNKARQLLWEINASAGTFE